MEITVAFSPCPNDTFIFDALVHQKIDTSPFVFKPVYADVETLNEAALRGVYDITKLSFHAYAYASQKYVLLQSGAALGKGCGPLLIAKDNYPLNEISNLHIAIPGVLTTANLLCSIALPNAKNKTPMVFSEIENVVLSGAVDAGVIIHENRFTYQQKGLKKIIDLGEYWETTYQLPIPLGAITVKRNIPSHLKQKINTLMRQSVEYAIQNPVQTLTYVKRYAQAMEENVMQQHIQLYVNNFTINLGDEGKRAINKLYEIASEKKLIPLLQQPFFI